MNGNPSAAYRHLTWEPILDTLRNLESLISEENPITLRYLYVSLHDINLAHMLASLGYYGGAENSYIPGTSLVCLPKVWSRTCLIVLSGFFL